MTRTSPTVRSLALLRKNGYSAQVTEKWNPYAKIRIDLFGFIDIVAIKENEIVGVQTTSASNMSTRVKKILAIPEAKKWLEADGKILVHGWAKKGARGKRKLWQTVDRWITLDDFEKGSK